MKLALNVGFLTSANPDPVPMAVEAERLGYDSVWTAEAWGSDAVTPEKRTKCRSQAEPVSENR